MVSSHDKISTLSPEDGAAVPELAAGGAVLGEGGGAGGGRGGELWGRVRSLGQGGASPPTPLSGYSLLCHQKGLEPGPGSWETPEARPGESRRVRLRGEEGGRRGPGAHLGTSLLPALSLAPAFLLPKVGTLSKRMVPG